MVAEVARRRRRHGAAAVDERPRRTAWISAGRGGGPNPLTELCRGTASGGAAARDKFVPDAIFGLADAQIARFLAVLYACDGHVYVSDRLSQIGYTTISDRLAHDVQHLLLRLGIVATIRTLRREVYEGTGTIAREVRITGRAELDTFARQVPSSGRRIARARGDRQSAVDLPNQRRHDPAAVWIAVLPPRALARGRTSARPPADRATTTGTSTRAACRAPSWPHSPPATQAPSSSALASPTCGGTRSRPSSRSARRRPRPGPSPATRDFVADDIVVHNSALMANFAENAALETNKAVALFSLEMSEAELAQRFIASQASIQGDDLRKGGVPERAGARSCGVERLAHSQLSSTTPQTSSVLDVRAKARRLAQQNVDGLGLILIDYLQLMRAGGNVENRVEQIGQISRGLKTLARELDVPVIALSQLNRGGRAAQATAPDALGPT